MLTDDYTVRLANFQGPLDLLLFLIRRAEVDVTALSIAEITDQFLHFLGEIERIDVEAAGEFLVTAATLLEIKSRLLAPAQPGDEDPDAGAPLDAALPRDTGSPAADLIRQLLAYRRFRDAADRLALRREIWVRRSPLAPHPPHAPHPGAIPHPTENAEVEDLSLFGLIQAYARIAETVQFDRLGDHKIVADDTPIELYATDVLDRLRRQSTAPDRAARMTMREVFAGRAKVEVIGLFLAILELMRQRVIRVLLNESTREVCVALRDTDDEEPGAAAAQAKLADMRSAAVPVGPRAWDDDDPFEADDEPGEDSGAR